MISLPRSFAVVSSLTLLSRVLGLARDVAIASVFPVGLHSDAFFTAFKIPNTLRRLTAEGALTQAFVPVFNAVRTDHGEQAAAELRNLMASWLCVLLVVLALLGVLLAPWLIGLLAPGFASIAGKQEVAAELLRITFPYIALLSLAAFGGAVLNSYGKFASFAFIPALLNLSLIFAAIVLAPQFARPIDALAWGVIGGGVLQLGWQAVAMLRHGQLPRPAMPRLNPELVKIAKLTAQGALGVSAAQLSIFISLIFASFLDQGSVSWLYFADRLMELPVGLIGAALGIVALPTLSRQYASADTAAYSATLDWNLRIALLFSIPAAVALAILALPLAATIFQHGSYTPDDSHQTALAIVAYSIGIPALVAIKVLAAGFFARQDMLTPVKVSIVALLVIIALNFALAPPLKHAGLALALSLGALLNATTLAWLLRGRACYSSREPWLSNIAKYLLAAAVMAAILWWLRGSAASWTAAGWLERVARLGGCVLAGAAAYFAVMAICGWRPRNLRLQS